MGISKQGALLLGAAGVAYGSLFVFRGGGAPLWELVLGTGIGAVALLVAISSFVTFLPALRQRLVPDVGGDLLPWPLPQWFPPRIGIPDIALLIPFILAMESMKVAAGAYGLPFLIAVPPPTPNASGQALLAEVRTLVPRGEWSAQGVQDLIDSYPPTSAQYQGLRALCDPAYFNPDIINHGAANVLGWPTNQAPEYPVGTIRVAYGAMSGKLDKHRLLARFDISHVPGGVYAPTAKAFPADAVRGATESHCVYVVRLAQPGDVTRGTNVLSVTHLAVIVPDSGRPLQIHRIRHHDDTQPTMDKASWSYRPNDDPMCISCERYGWCEVHEPIF